ncbi:MAG: hypothetical protein DWQ36_02800 [Acidobacteria bacterium]|nr:MAG: hypothetical protein DWQ30_02605 [Acidobacteriota bacterium]REK11055.1 MAG: hypothetical protein DWQ36_02800 [Acidobacteriota bacterium]
MTAADLSRLALLGQLATTLPLVGLIWTVQLVHYPLFRLVGVERFPEYHAQHSLWISVVVMPLMLAELALAVAWAALPPDVGALGLSGSRTALLGLLLVAAVWIATFALSVPQHALLAEGFDAAAHARLVSTNWLRTAAWTGRAGLLMAVAWKMLR